MGYLPPAGYAVQRHGSNISREALPGNQGLIPANPGLVSSTQGLVKANEKPNVVARHQRWGDNPFADARWPFTPTAAEHFDGRNILYGQSNYQRLPFDNRAESAVGPLVRAGPSRQGSGLNRYGSGDHHADDMIAQRGSAVDRLGSRMLRQASSLGHTGLGMPLHGSGMPWEQQWAPMLTAADAVAGVSGLVMHGPHSLLERPGPGESSGTCDEVMIDCSNW